MHYGWRITEQKGGLLKRSERERERKVEDVPRNFRDPARKEMNPLNVLHFPACAESIPRFNEILSGELPRVLSLEMKRDRA